MQVSHDPAKLAALKLATLNWWDRQWIISKLPKEQKAVVKSAFFQLKKLNIKNEKAILLQLSEQVSQAGSQSNDDLLGRYIHQISSESSRRVSDKVKSMLAEHLSSNTKPTSVNMG
ncbi:hypothetical protein [Pseudoalteromonas aurantia]|uniref:Uncharacterized protein n=1 Tax=Pseudoalteromonas aurantia TaxID=43654 RepID=A0A5S3V6A8_9GAMM|nr:hypothetical protein [Pseudoalteromonas aurantia]TMO66629.1 hypothetical protein CWC19_15810 [Pseudoalteromonas aurantia]